MNSPAAWIGRRESLTEVIAAFPARGLAATLNRDETFAPGTDLPPLWHWLHALKAGKLAESGPDGHEAPGHFLPPLAHARRMWAGGSVVFHAPLRIGALVQRTSTVTAIEDKAGRSGPLSFVTVHHLWTGASGRLIDEHQHLVYRDAHGPAPIPQLAAENADFSRAMVADEVMLFRYSALTFNPHRIHYDRDFCRNEGYAGLVVHGPLLATLLLDLLRTEGGALPRRFEFRARAPVTVNQPFTLCARIEAGDVLLWVRRADGALAMDARAGL